MKHIFALGAAMVSISTLPAMAQMPEPAPPVETVVFPAPPAEPAVIQANPTGPGVPTFTPPNPAVAAEPVAPAFPVDPAYQAGPYKGALTAPPPEALNKVYPPCSRTLQDNCRNRGGV